MNFDNCSGDKSRFKFVKDKTCNLGAFEHNSITSFLEVNIFVEILLLTFPLISSIVNSSQPLRSGKSVKFEMEFNFLK